MTRFKFLYKNEVFRTIRSVSDTFTIPYGKLCHKLNEVTSTDTIDNTIDITQLVDNYRYLSHFIYTYTDRSIIASLSRVCSDCAKNGSALAENVLLTAGSDLAESVIRAAKRSGIAKMDFPVLASGSVLMNDDIVFGAMKERLEREMPQAKLIRAPRPQVCGQVVAKFMKLDPVNYRAVMLDFFANYHNIHNKKS